MSWRLFSVYVLLLIGGSSSFEYFRLPRQVVPDHYKIQILTDLGNDFTYRGKVFIDFEVVESTDRVVLHSKNLGILENATRLEEGTGISEPDSGNDIQRVRRNVYVTTDGTHYEKSEDSVINDYNGTGQNETKLDSDAIVFPENDEETFQSEPTGLPQSPAPSATDGTRQSDNATTAQPEHPSRTDSLTTVTFSTNDNEKSQTTQSTATEMTKTTTEEVFTIVDDLQTAVFISQSPVEDPVTFISVMTSEKPASTIAESSTHGPSTTKTEEEIKEKPDTEYIVAKHEYHLENNFLIIHFNKSLVQGKRYRLELNYQGILSDSLTGFHRVPYVKKASQKSTWLASTVFEPSEARTAFPCFDEPDFKATFDIVLGHAKKYTALSNMPLKETAPVEGKPEWQWSIFETSPKMPTYLVAFLISDLEYLTPRQNNSTAERNVTYRFWSRHDVLYKTRYAMRIAPEMKNYLEDLLQVRDVLPKHDFIALPSFVSTALENWGLYSFAEKNLLFSPGFSSIFSKFQITQVLAHEIAHMWFGNMVTPKWWDQVWLSEGFSNFFEIIAADHVQPSWDLKTTSIIFAYLKVFSLDALYSSHPLVPKFDEPKDLNEIFDSISYQKGFYLVRMLNYTLGQEAFMTGLRKYLKTNLLSNVEEDDLWEALNDYAHQEANLSPEYHLKEIMHNWTKRAGYPIIQVTRDYNNNTASLTQRRFLRFRGDYEFRDNSHDYKEDDTRWWVPITYTTGSEMNFLDTKPKLWLDPARNSVTLTDMPSKDDFVLMNLDAAGLYRVNYDERNWALIISYLLTEDHSDISILNRVQILDDLLDLARSGDVSYEMALEATGYLKREKHFLPWKAALSNFDFISRMFRSRNSNRTLKKFLRNLISPRFEELGFEVVRNETFSDSLNRKQIATWACKTGLRQCTRKSISLFRRWMQEKRPDENNPIPSSLRSVVYCSAIENGGSKEWQFLWQRYLNNVLTDKTAVLYGLGCTKNTRTLRKYLDWSLRETSGIRKQDAPVIFKAVARNDAGFYLAKTFLKEKLGDMRRYLGNHPFFLPQMIDTLASKMNHPSDLQDLEDMETETYSDYRTTPRCFRQAFERVRFNIDWTEKNYPIITDWLRRQKL